MQNQDWFTKTIAVPLALSCFLLNVISLPSKASSVFSADIPSTGSADCRDWMHFNPFKYHPAEKLVPSASLINKKAAMYLKGTPSFPHDPLRTNVVYGRGVDHLPTEIYAKAFDILQIANKYFQAPAAGEVKNITVNGLLVSLYGTSTYTPLKNQSFVANPVQVSPFDPTKIFYKENEMWPSVIYGQPGQEILIANQKVRIPAAGQSEVVVFDKNGRLKAASSSSSQSEKIASETNSSKPSESNISSSNSSTVSGTANPNTNASTSSNGSATNATESHASTDQVAAEKVSSETSKEESAVETSVSESKEGTSSTGTDSTSTDSTGTGSTSTGSTGTGSTGTGSAGTGSTGTGSTGTGSGGTGSTGTGSTGTGSTSTGSTSTGSTGTGSTGTGSTGTGSTGTGSTGTASTGTASTGTGSVGTGTGGTGDTDSNQLAYEVNTPYKLSAEESTSFGDLTRRILNTGTYAVDRNNQVLTGMRNCIFSPDQKPLDKLYVELPIAIAFPNSDVTPRIEFPIKTDANKGSANLINVKGRFQATPFSPTGRAMGEVAQEVDFYTTHATKTVAPNQGTYYWPYTIQNDQLSDPTYGTAEIKMKPELISIVSAPPSDTGAAPPPPKAPEYVDTRDSGF